MQKTEIYKRLYKDYSKKYLDKIILSALFSIVVAGSTSAIAWLLDPAIKKLFIEKDQSLIIFIPLMIILAFTTKGLSLYFAKATMISVGEEIKKKLQFDMVNSLIKTDKLGKVLVYVHEKDHYESSKTVLSFLSNPRTVKLIDLSDTKCKEKVMLGGYHGIALTKCFANEDPKSKEIAKYLEEIF